MAPTVGFIILLAPEIVVGIYGSQWKEAIVPLQIIGSVGIFRAVYNAIASFLKARGRVINIVYCQAVYAASMILLTWIGAVHYGLRGASLGVSASIFIMYAMVVYMVQSELKIDSYDTLECHKPGFYFAIPVLASAYSTKYAVGMLALGNLITILLCGAVSAITAILSLYYMPSSWLAPVPRTIVSVTDGYVPTRLSSMVRVVLG